MPNLGDYLGQLLAEISLARMHADLETVRLAELYATHPLLRTMPVPRVRLPDVELDLPVLIKSTEAPRAGESARGGVSSSILRTRFDQLFADHLDKSGVKLAAGDNKKLDQALTARLSEVDLPAEISAGVYRMADELTAAAMESTRQIKSVDPDRRKLLEDGAPQLANAVRREFVKLRGAPPRLDVAVTSSEIREAGNSGNVTRLRLKISEQGVEWTTVESGGVQQDRLVPE